MAVLRSLIGLMAQPALGLRRDLVLGTLIELVGIGLTTMGPFVLKILVDRLADGDLSMPVAAALVTAFVLTWSGATFTAALKFRHTMRLIDGLSRALIGRAMASRLPDAASRRDGDSGRTLGQLERLPYSLQLVVDGLIGRVAPMTVQLVVSLAAAATAVPIGYVLILAVVLLAYAGATQGGAGRFHIQAKATNAAATGVSQRIGDVLRNARRVVLNGTTAQELAAIDDEVGVKRAATERLSSMLIGTAAVQYLVIGAGLVVLLVLAANDVGRGRITVGDFVLLQAYAFRLAVPLGGIGFIVRQAGVSLANVGEVLAIGGGGTNGAVPRHPASPATSIRLEGVGFRYGGPEAPDVLSGVDAAIAPGAFVVIAGANGSGKSTLAQLTAGLMEPSEGRILIDGQPAQADDRLRRLLYVPQLVGLFNRTLRDNALYPPTRLDDVGLAALLDAWRFHPDGRAADLDLIVGEQGERLSGGQIQKLELARLTGVEAPAVLLDETTSALDRPSEAAAIAALRDAYRGHTTLILVSHRLWLAEAADMVVFLEAGRAVAGDHATLAATSPGYRAFWAMKGG
nr:ABC transporter ATP-binding protein [Hephaestia sp. MAHUQ-44]